MNRFTVMLTHTHRDIMDDKEKIEEALELIKDLCWKMNSNEMLEERRLRVHALNKWEPRYPNLPSKREILVKLNEILDPEDTKNFKQFGSHRPG